MNSVIVNLPHFITKIIALFLSLSTFLWPVGDYRPADKSELSLSAVAIADLHIEEDTGRDLLLWKALHDMSHYSAGINALIMAGDLTEKGNQKQYEMLYRVLTLSNTAEYTLAAMGNHDSKGGGEGFDTARQRFTDYQSAYTGTAITNTYYYQVIDGYYFVVLGTQDYIGCPAYFTDEELQWVDDVLDEAADSGKPVFLINHQPFNGTNRIDEAWPEGKMGDQSDELRSIVESYTDTGTTMFFISGHIHDSFGWSGVTHDGNLYFIDVPSFGKTPSKGDINEVGTGYLIEVYENSVLFRARNFVKNEWLSDYDCTVNLT